MAMPTPNRAQKKLKAFTAMPERVTMAAKMMLAQPMMGTRRMRSAAQPMGMAPRTTNAPDQLARKVLGPATNPHGAAGAGAWYDRGGGRAMAPGDLEKSEAWARILSKEEDEVMPPPKSHKKLTVADKNVLKRWIQQGAKYEGHWSFVAPANQEVPKIAGAENPIDAFLQDRLGKEGLKPATIAKPETLVRRLYLDLTGLPPATTEVDAFLANLSLIHISAPTRPY